MKEQKFFKNGYGVSIIQNDFSYGLEMAILKGNEDDWEVCYDTPITDDVLAHQDEESLDENIKRVKALPSCIDS